MPNAVCSLLLESGVRDLGIHTEMLTDGIVDLYKAGCRDRRHARRSTRGKFVFSFALGSQYLYDAIDAQPRHLVPARSSYTNLPHIIMQNDRDDLDQQHDADGSARPGGLANPTAIATSAAPAASCSSCAARMRRKAASRSSACLPPTSAAGVRKSRIVLRPDPRQHRHDAAHATSCTSSPSTAWSTSRGSRSPERAKAMISIAHPDFREDLEREARANGLIPKPFG